MLLSDALKSKLHDVRLRDKLMAEGKVSRAEVDQYMKELEDDEKNAQNTSGQ